MNNNLKKTGKNQPQKHREVHGVPNSKSKNQKKITISGNTWYLLAGIIVVTAIAFSGSLKGEFLNWDDKAFIVDNTFIKDFSIQGIKNIFIAIDQHDPIVAFTHAFTYHFWGLNPLPFRIINLLFHLLNVLLVYFFILKISGKNEIGLIAALFFALHPCRVESVAWISERKDVLYVFFYLAALIVYINYMQNKNKLRDILFSLILFVIALLSKLSAVTLPVVLILINYFYGRKFTPGVILELLPFFILAVLRGMVHLMSGITISGNEIITTVFPLYDRIFIGSHAMIFYLASLFYFFNLCDLHPYPVKTGTFLPAEYYVDFAVVVIIALLVFRMFIKYSKFRKEMIFGLLFFLINISLVMHIIPFGGGVVVADRYSYMSYIGIFYLFGVLYTALTDKGYQYAAMAKKYLTVFGIIFLLLCAVVTFGRNHIWLNTTAVWTDAVEHYPQHFYGYIGLGDAKSELGDYDGAMAEYNKAIELNPKFNETYLNRGSLKYNHFKDSKGAIEDFSKAIECNPNYTTAYTNRGLAKVSINDMQGAFNDFNKAIQIDPDFAMAYFYRGKWLANSGNFNGAINDYNRAVQINPLYADAFNDRGIVYSNMKDYSHAMKDFNHVLEIDPNNAQAYMNIGSTKFFTNDRQGACANWQKSYQLGYKPAADLINQNCR